MIQVVLSSVVWNLEHLNKGKNCLNSLKVSFFLWGKFFSHLKKITSLLEKYIILQKKINSCELEFKAFLSLCTLFFFLLISDDLGELIKSKYSKFLVKNFLNYG